MGPGLPCSGGRARFLAPLRGCLCWALNGGLAWGVMCAPSCSNTVETCKPTQVAMDFKRSLAYPAVPQSSLPYTPCIIPPCSTPNSSPHSLPAHCLPAPVPACPCCLPSQPAGGHYWIASGLAGGRGRRRHQGLGAHPTTRKTACMHQAAGV